MCTQHIFNVLGSNPTPSQAFTGPAAMAFIADNFEGTVQGL